MTSLLQVLVSVTLVFGAVNGNKNRLAWLRRARQPLSRSAIEKREGPNVCAVEEVLGTRRRYYSDCMPRLPRQICGKQTLVRYHCCTGYERTNDGERGCMGVKPVRDLMTTVRDMYMIDMYKSIQSSGLEEKFQEPGPYTLFVPHRLAIRDLDDDTKMLLSTNDQSKNLLRMHATEGRYYKKDLLHEMEIPSIYYYQDEGLLKIHNYRNGIRTVNCVRLIMTDIIASNGIMHITEKVIQPYPNRGTIMDILLRGEEFTELVTALIVSDLGNELRETGESYTVFAPTDRAFRSAPSEIINRILNDKGLVRKLLRYHQTQNVICSPSIIRPTRVRSREGQKLNLTCDVNDQIRVNNVPIAKGDIVAFNGVIHVLDELLIPDSVKSLKDIMDEMNMGRFIEYAQQAGLQGVLSGQTPGNYTVFVPSTEAFEALSDDQKLKLQTDSQFVKDTFRYHVVPELLTTQDMNDGEALDTLAQIPLRVSIYQKKHIVNSALIVNPDHVVGNGAVHIVNKVLLPPQFNALETIKQDPRLSTFQSVLQTSGYDRLLEANGHYTIFAPTNRAFDRLPRRVLEEITGNDEELKKAIGYHILEKPVYSSSLRHGLQYRFESLVKKWVRLKVKNAETGVLVNNRVYVSEGDQESTSGVIHIIDDLLKCPSVRAFTNMNF